MAQQFQADAQANASGAALANGVATQTILGNFLQAPFGNFKAKVRGSCVVGLGTVPTSMTIALVRNPNSDNLTIATSGAITQGVAANGIAEVQLDGTDAVPDGRPVQYGVVMTVAGTGTANTANRNYIEATLLSG